MSTLTAATYNNRGVAQTLEIIDSDGGTYTDNTFRCTKGSLVISQDGPTDDPFSQRIITGNLSCSFRLINDSLLDFYDRLTSSPEGRFFVKYTLDGEVEFLGVVQPDVGGVPLDVVGAPLLTITAVDILTDITGREMTSVKGDGKYYSLGEHLAHALKHSSIYDELYGIADVVLVSNVPIYTSAMTEPCDPLMEIAVQDFIWRERDSDLNPYNYADADLMLTDIANGLGARIYCSKGRVVIENLLQRTNTSTTYWEYTKSSLSPLTKPLATLKSSIVFGQRMYDRVAVGGNRSRKTYSSLHTILPPARGVQITKTGWGYVNLLRGYSMSATATQLTGSGLTWSGVYGSDIQLTTVNEVGDQRVIIDLSVECYVDGAGNTNLREEYDLEVTWMLRVGDRYLTNANGVTTLFVNPESAALLDDCVWSTSTADRLIYSPLYRIPTRGEATAGHYERRRIHNVRLLSEPIPVAGDLHFEIENIKIINPSTGTETTLPNGSTVVYRFTGTSRIGIGEELSEVFAENDTTDIYRLTEAANKQIYQIETTLIDYADNPNDSRALVLRGADPAIGMTMFRDDNLNIAAKLDALLMFQAISLVQDPAIRVLEVDVDSNISLDDVYLHKKRGEETLYTCMPVKRTYNCDLDRTQLTAMVLSVGAYAGGSTQSEPIPTGQLEFTDLINSQLTGDGAGGSGGSIYPTYFSAEVTGTEVTVTGINLPDPDDIDDDVRRLLVVQVAGSEYYLVSSISTDPATQRGQVTTDTTGGNNKIIFGRSLRGQRVTVRQYGYINNTPPPSQ